MIEAIVKVPFAWVVSEGLGVVGIDTVHDVRSETEWAVSRSDFLREQPTLVQRQVVRSTVEEIVAFAVITS